MHHAIVKYGWDKFITEILETDLILAEANIKERYYISEYDTVVNGYNLERGGRNSEPSEYMIELARNRKPMLGKRHSNETKRKMSLKHTGKIMSEQSKQKMSASQKARMTPEYKKILSIKCSGWHHTDEAKKKIGLRSLGNKNALGRVQSVEERKLRSLSAKSVLPLMCGHKRHNRYSKCIIKIEGKNENNNNITSIETQIS